MWLQTAHADAFRENRGIGALNPQTPPEVAEKLLERLWYYMKRFQHHVNLHAQDLLLIGAPGAVVFLNDLHNDKEYHEHMFEPILQHLAAMNSITTINFAWCFSVLSKFMARFEAFGVWWLRKLDEINALPFKLLLLCLNLGTLISQYVYEKFLAT